MAVSSRHSGWRIDKDNSRLDIYYAGARIGAIDAGGIDLAAGLTYDVDGVAVTASTLDAAYDGGTEIAVDGDAVTLTGTHGTKDVLAITGAGTGALIDLTQASTGKDIEGTGDTWTVSAAGAAVFTTIAGTSLTLSSDIDMSASATGTYDLILKDSVADALSIRRSTNDVIVFDTSTPKVTITPATVITGGLTVTTGAITVSAGTTSAITSTNINLTGIVGITGATTVTGDLAVTGNMTWGSTLTVDELVLDTDGASPAASNAYIARVSGNLLINTITGQEHQFLINAGEEFTIAAASVSIHGNSLLLDANENTYLDVATDDTIKFYISGSQDFTMAANLFSVLSGSVLNVNDDTLFQIGTTGDGAFWHTAAGIGANTAVGGVLIGTPVNYASAANSTIISNITASGDIQLAVNKGGHSQTVLFADASAGNVYVNATASGSVLLAVANVTEYTFDATTLTIAAANDIKFAGNDGILDSSGNEVILVEAVGSAVNYLNVLNAATANNIVLECKGTADKGFTFINQEDEEILILNSAATSVCNIQITSAVEGTNAKIETVTSGTNAGMTLDTAGTGNITLMLGGVDALVIHDAAITLAAATDVAGHALYMQTEDGGTDGGTASTGQAGGAWEMRTGDGTAAQTTGAVGGAGGALSLISGLGHDGDGAGAGGAGGAIAITAGEGGDAGTGAAGAGGSITLTAGAGGGVGGGTTGVPGSIVIGAGVLKLKRQTIDMANGTIALTLDPTDPVLGTLLTGNVLIVDPNGGTNVLKLPDEDDADGVFLVIENAADGAEDITLQNDAAGAVVTIGQNEVGYAHCDGTTWTATTGVI